jgi:hypothetical protein
MRERLHNQRKIQRRDSARAGSRLPVFPVADNVVAVAAPQHCSAIDNPIETILWFNQVKASLRKRSTMIDLRLVDTLTSDALIGLVAAVVDTGGPKNTLSGNIPINAGPKAVFETCGFDRLTKELRYKTSTARGGHITTEVHAARGVECEGEKVDRAISWACAMATIPYSNVSFENAMECMANTNNHAGKEIGSVQWRMMVNFDRLSKTVRFAFVDPGRGICKTLKSWLGPSLSKISLSTDEQVLKYLLVPPDNRLQKVLTSIALAMPQHTRTGKVGRGRGLRSIADSVPDEGVSRLVVIANRAYVDVTQQKTLHLPRGSEMPGTMIYWEVTDHAGAFNDQDQ